VYKNIVEREKEREDVAVAVAVSEPRWPVCFYLGEGGLM
jgi:hypothetical protein